MPPPFFMANHFVGYTRGMKDALAKPTLNFDSKALRKYLRPRLLHPVLAFLLVLCCSGLSSFGVPCSAACSTSGSTMVTNSDFASMSECCSSQSERMACCTGSSPIHDLLAVSISNLELGSFALLPPNTFTSLPTVSVANARLCSACATGQSQQRALKPCKIYLINRQLLI